MAQAQMTPAMLAQIVSAVMAMNGGKTAKSTKPAPKTKAESLESKDKSILRQFEKRGYKNVELMDRTDPKKPFNVRPFKGWLEQKRIVRKGEKSVRGLFHVSQTDVLPEKTA